MERETYRIEWRTLDKLVAFKKCTQDDFHKFMNWVNKCGGNIVRPVLNDQTTRLTEFDKDCMFTVRNYKFVEHKREYDDNEDVFVTIVMQEI